MADLSNDIKRYLNGEMTPAEMHALEKKALSDPFLADALEGGEAEDPLQFARSVAALNEAVDATGSSAVRAASAPEAIVQPASAEKPGGPPVTPARWAMRIAASLILLAAATAIIWQFATMDEQDSLALNETTRDKQAFAEKDDEAEHPIPAPSAEEGPRVGDSAPAGTGTYPQEAKAKQGEVVPDSKKTAPKGEGKPDSVRLGLPVLAETTNQPAPVARDEKPEELALATQREEEGKLQKKDTRADEDRQKVSEVTRSRVQGAKRVIRGKVTSSEDGSPLPGVNVVIKGTSIGTVTDASGLYQMAADQTNPSLIFSFIGLQSQEVNAGDRKQVDVQMALDAMQLSEVIVTGYGIQKNGTPDPPTIELAHPSIGDRAYKKYLESNLLYPQEALDKKVEGRVTVEFFVETDGTVSAITVVRGIGAGCDEELIRLIKEGSRWEPTRRDGVPIRDKARVRLKFEMPKK